MEFSLSYSGGFFPLQTCGLTPWHLFIMIMRMVKSICHYTLYQKIYRKRIIQKVRIITSFEADICFSYKDFSTLFFTVLHCTCLCGLVCCRSQGEGIGSVVIFLLWKKSFYPSTERRKYITDSRLSFPGHWFAKTFRN